MTPEQVQQLRGLLKLGRIPDNDPSLKYEFRKGWNDGVAFAENQLDKIAGKATEESK